MTFYAPRCRHGNIILGCPFEPCPEQDAYLADQRVAMDRYYSDQIREARTLLGLPL